MRLNGIEHRDYTTLVSGNDGEEQLIIAASPGQCGRTALLVAQASVDVGMQVLLNDVVRSDRVEEALRAAIAHWDRPNAIGADTAGNVDRIVEEFTKHWDAISV